MGDVGTDTSVVRKKPPDTAFPICQNVHCSKNNLSDRIFWKRELDHQYRFYLATLRAERDARYVIQEHSDLLHQIEIAEATNVELRKQIRHLEMELHIVYQRNAHDSYVIDGLHEADYEAGETELLKHQTLRKLDIAAAEGDHEDSLIEMLKKEIDLLQRKNGEDRELFVSFKPLEEQLKKTLEVEKLKNHQQAMKFKRDLEEILDEFRKRNSDLQAITSAKSSEITWIAEIFSSVYGSKPVGSHVASTDDVASTKSSQETEHFESTAQEEIPDVADLGDDFQRMKEEYCEFVALKELLDSKNAVNLHLIYDCLQGFTESVHELTNEYLSVFEIFTDVEYIKEFMDRLNTLLKKRGTVQNNENSIQTAQRLDQLNIIYNTLLTEKELFGNSLRYFMSTLKEDFEAHCVILHKTEELYTVTKAQ